MVAQKHDSDLTVIGYAAYGQIAPNSQRCHLADSVRSVSFFFIGHICCNHCEVFIINHPSGSAD